MISMQRELIDPEKLIRKLKQVIKYMQDNNIEDFGIEVKKAQDSNKRTKEQCVPQAVEPSSSSSDMWGIIDRDFEKNPSVFAGYPPSLKTLPSDIYTITFSDRYGPMFNKRSMVCDEFIEFSNGYLSSILDDIDLFWTKEDDYNYYGFTFKRGLLLYGTAGGGKTILIQQAIKRFISKYDGIIVLNNQAAPTLVEQSLLKLRQLEPTRKVMVVMEDIDAYIGEWGEESILSFLDGETSLNRCFVVATTNYPEKLDKRIVSRPRRFDRIIKIEPPNASMRKEYLENKLKLTNGETDKFVEATEGFTFAALAELVISVKCLNKDFDESCNFLRNILTKKKSSSDFDGVNVGFLKQ